MLLFLSMAEGENEKCKFERIYEKYRYFMWYIGNEILIDDKEAERAVAESFLVLAKYLDRIEEGDSGMVRNFVATITRSVALKIRRENHGIEWDTELGTEGAERIHLERFLNQRAVSDVEELILEMDQTHRTMLELKYLHGFSDREIAGLIGMNIKNMIACNTTEAELLKQVLEECLTDEVEYMPADSEIRQQHRLSEKFMTEMCVVLQREERKARRTRRNLQKYLTVRNVGAAILLILLCVLVVLVKPWKITYVSNREATDQAEDQVDTKSGQEVTEESKEDAGNILSEVPDTTDKDTEILAESEDTEDSFVWTYQNGSIMNGEIEFELGNGTADTISYGPIIEIELQNQKGTYSPVYAGKKKSEMYTLRAGEKLEEKMNLEEYGIVVPGHYRLIRSVNGTQEQVEIDLTSVDSGK